VTRTVGIIGHPVAHSLSPVFQGAAFRAHGLDVTYERWDTPDDLLPARIAALRDANCLGANVTIPHKEAVFPYLDELGGQSSRVGAVNTIVNREGRLFGFNTDGPGFIAALKNESNFDPAGKHILLLGAGGAARGIAFALLDAGVRALSIWNRTPARAAALALALESAATPAPRPGDDGEQSVSVTELAEPSISDCVINCTSIGMHGGGAESATPCDPGLAPPRALFVDIVYAPERTPFLLAAEAAGHRTLGGLPMLVYQGALAFELWTGIPAPVDVMFEAARNALAERERRP
jgi:shikimate dehydrogenase